MLMVRSDLCPHLIVHAFAPSGIQSTIFSTVQVMSSVIK